jgi:hypothetical protein
MRIIDRSRQLTYFRAFGEGVLEAVHGELDLVTVDESTKGVGVCRYWSIPSAPKAPWMICSRANQWLH